MRITPLKIQNFNPKNTVISTASKTYVNRNNYFKYQVPSTYPKVYFTGFKTSVNTDFKSNFNKILKKDSKYQNPFFKKVNQDSINKLNSKIINNPKSPIVIGITGESASGKSTFTRLFAKKLKNEDIEVSIINADNYFKDVSAKIQEAGSFDKLIENGYNLDSPDNFYLDTLTADIETLKNGEDIKTPEYLINGTGISVPNKIPVKAKRVILIEGMATTFEPVRSALDLSVYVDIDNKTRKQRFLNRASSRNQTQEDALRLFNYTKNAGKEYLLPAKNKTDIIVDGKYSYKDFNELFD